MITDGIVLRHQELDRSDFTIVGGGAAWIDTDVSAVTGLNSQRVWVLSSNLAAGQANGARPKGSALQPYGYGNLLHLSRADSTGHMELMRGAGACVYTIVGYLEAV